MWMRNQPEPHQRHVNRRPETDRAAAPYPFDAPAFLFINPIEISPAASFDRPSKSPSQTTPKTVVRYLKKGVRVDIHRQIYFICGLYTVAEEETAQFLIKEV
jgi:hypothetical protein